MGEAHNSGLLRASEDPQSIALAQIERRLIAREKALALLNTIQTIVGHATDVHQMLGEVLSQVLAASETKLGLLSLLDERGKHSEIVSEGVARSFARSFYRMIVARFIEDVRMQLLDANAFAGRQQPEAMELGEQGIKSFVCVPLRSQDRLLGVLALFRPVGNDFSSEDIELLTSVANHIAVVFDNARLYQGLKDHIKETEVLYKVGRTLISTLDHDEVLRQILRVVQESFGYSRCGILLVDEESGDLYVKAAHGHAPEVTKDVRLKVGHEGITGLVASTGQPLNVPDVARYPHYVSGPSPSASELALPLKIGTQVIGVLDVQSNKIAAFGERDLRILSSFADQAAIAIENARLYNRTKQMGVMEERNRLAREIHDVLAQNLTGTIVHLEAADSLLIKGNYEKAQEVLRKAMEQARVSLQEARRSIAGLRATPLEYLPLSQVLASDINGFTQETGVDVSLRLTGDDTVLAPDLSMALYRICTEGMNNVRRHAAAKNVEILLDVGQYVCLMSIHDDGIGFDPSLIDYKRSADNGFGLIGMRERARLLGGTMSIESSVGAGTRIKIEIPMKNSRSEEGVMSQ